MSKYIDTEAFKKRILSYGIVHEGDRIPIPYYKPYFAEAYVAMLRWVCEEVDDTPAADVQEVRHGRWLMTDAYPHRVYCSECYATLIPNVEWFKTYNIASNYCPNCGAKMDGEQNE